MSPGRFKAILRNQLQVTEADFWTALEKEEPVARPSEQQKEEATLPAYLVRVLKDELHLSEPEIGELSLEEAQRLVHERWSQPD